MKLLHYFWNNLSRISSFNRYSNVINGNEKLKSCVKILHRECREVAQKLWFCEILSTNCMNQLSSNQKFLYYKIIFSSTTPMLSLKISFMTVKDEYRCIRCIRCKFVYLYSTLRKKPPYSELFWSTLFPHFPAFGLNTERYSVSLRIQSECGEIRDKCGPE